MPRGVYARKHSHEEIVSAPPRKAVPITKTHSAKIVVLPNKEGEGVFDPLKLGATVRTRLHRLEVRLARTRDAFGKQGLRVGEILFKINALLAPHRMFQPYLETIPWMPTASAYRAIRAYELAQNKLTEPVLNRVLVSGLPMFGSEEKPYGRFTDAVEKVGAPPQDAKKADTWLTSVREEYKQALSRRARKKVSVQDVVERAAANLLRQAKAAPSVTPEKFLKLVEEQFTALQTATE